MNAAPAQPGFSRARWWGVIALIFAAQAGLIFLLGAKHPVTPRSPHLLPPISLATGFNPELAELLDPTFFALPHRRGFSGAALALAPHAGYVADDWTEPFRPLPLPVENLGQTFRQLNADNVTPPLAVAEKIEPQISALENIADALALPAHSTLRIEGGLAGRALLAPLELPLLSSADVLPPTVVRVIVDAAGNVISAAPVASCGLADADEKALTLARVARFEPLPGGEKSRITHPQSGLSWGKMNFQWQVVPPTEEPAANP